VIDTIIPIRCLSCGKPVAGLWEKYKERTEAGENPGKVMDDLGLERYCCRSLFLTHRDTLKKVARFRV
jgi:DNA-directed RNA polymerase subunit N